MGFLNGESTPVTRGEVSQSLFPKDAQKAAQKRVEAKRKARVLSNAAPSLLLACKKALALLESRECTRKGLKMYSVRLTLEEAIHEAEEIPV